MERQSPNVSEPRAPEKPDEDRQADDNSQSRAPDKPDDDRGSSSFWSIIYSVITHPFRVVGNLLSSSWRRTSEADDNSQSRAPDKPDDDRVSSSFWSIIYSVITHPFRVVGNLLSLSWRRTSERMSPRGKSGIVTGRSMKLSKKSEIYSIFEWIKTEKPVAILHPVPPAPPPPNPPI